MLHVPNIKAPGLEVSEKHIFYVFSNKHIEHVEGPAIFSVVFIENNSNSMFFIGFFWLF